MKTKRRMRAEVKEITSEGSFEGILSPYGGVPDSYGDVVERGAYAKTLKEKGTTRPLLWQHGAKDPIGLLTLEDRADGLWCSGQLLMEDDLAMKAYRFIKAGVVTGLSIGFETLNDTVKAGVRYLTEIKLYEGSIVTFPANESALITAVKSALDAKGDFNEELTEIQLCQASYQMRSALCSSLDSIVWADLARDEKIAATETVIQQFSDAYMNFIPSFLDMMTEMYGGMDAWSTKRFEMKDGRKISASTKSSISTAHEHLKSATDILSALITDEAGATTSEGKSREAEPEPEPILPPEPPKPDHSEFERKLNELWARLAA
jgi:HK97 family phage prohead protease